MKKNEVKISKKELECALEKITSGEIKHKDIKKNEVRTLSGLLKKLTDGEFQEFAKGNIPAKKLTSKEMELARGGWWHWAFLALHLAGGASPESEHHGREDGAAFRKKLFGGS